MLVEDVKKLPVQERFLYWIKERESIRLKKESGEPKPWTDDEILQTYRFCNVRRMDDKVSQWLLNNWYEPNFDHPNMLLACALARFINLPGTLEEIEFPARWAPSLIVARIESRKARNLTVFNGAYIISGAGRGSKVSNVVFNIVDQLKPLRRNLDTSSFKNCWNQIVDFRGIGSFMAGQIVADLRHAVPGAWDDVKFWAPIGPGSNRGLNRLLASKLNQHIRQSVFEVELEKLSRILERSLPDVYARLEGIDVQNCLCEFDKYERTLLEGRRPKQNYGGDK